MFSDSSSNNKSHRKNPAKPGLLCGTFSLFCPRMNGQQNMRLIGIEPTHAAPEAAALSTELQTHHSVIVHENREKFKREFWFTAF
jgi:hypothetical protein